jgi:hypothetical protein
MIRSLVIVTIFLSGSAAISASATDAPPGLVFQAFGGVPVNIPTTLTITRDGEPDIVHDAHWESRPLEQPIYWALRVRWQRANDGFELQLLHHKMYLENPPPTIEHFEVTHGFNILTAGYMRRTLPLHWRVGAGVTMPNTFATVQGELSDVHDYSIGGPAFLAGLGGELPVAGRLHLAADAQFIAAWGTDDVARGEARVTSLAFHFLLGLGYVF